jgi:hypothetical protein
MTYSEKYAKVHKMHLALQYENKRQLMHLMLNQYSVDIAMTYRYGGREVEYRSIYKLLSKFNGCFYCSNNKKTRNYSWAEREFK